MKVNYENSLICLAILVFLTIACDGGSTTIGHVVDSTNKPVKNASVKVEVGKTANLKESYDCKTETDNDGRFHCGFLHPSISVQLKMTVSKEGYKTNVFEFSDDEARKKIENKEEYKIVLEKE